MKVGDKIKIKSKFIQVISECGLTFDVDCIDNDGERIIEEIRGDLFSADGDNGELWFKLSYLEGYEQTDQHYNNDKGSLYLFAEQHDLNAWEFDIIKRITRCRKKGQFIEDLEKTKRVIDLYLKEYDGKTIG
jgi:hypothetical protein